MSDSNDAGRRPLPGPGGEELRTALGEGDPQWVAALIEAGADIRYKRDHGYDALLDAVHGVAFESYERAIDAHVKNLRRKIEPEPGRPRYVLTVHGVGYRFADA